MTITTKNHPLYTMDSQTSTYYLRLHLAIHADNAPTSVEVDLDLLGASLPRVLGLEDLAELLEGLAGGLDEEEVDDDDLDHDPDDVDQVQLPADGLHADADAVRVDYHGDVEEQVVEAGPLGARPVLQALNRVQRLQRREPPRETDPE